MLVNVDSVGKEPSGPRWNFSLCYLISPMYQLSCHQQPNNSITVVFTNFQFFWGLLFSYGSTKRRSKQLFVWEKRKNIFKNFFAGVILWYFGNKLRGILPEPIYIVCWGFIENHFSGLYFSTSEVPCWEFLYDTKLRIWFLNKFVF